MCKICTIIDFIKLLLLLLLFFLASHAVRNQFMCHIRTLFNCLKGLLQFVTFFCRDRYRENNYLKFQLFWLVALFVHEWHAE